MPAPNHSKIRIALRSIMLAVSGIPNKDTHIAWENRQFTPPVKPEPWMRETYLPDEDRHITNDQIESAGIMVYDIFVPTGSGTEASEELVKSICAAYNANQAISHDGVQVAVDRVTTARGGTTSNEPWFMYSVRVYWRSYTLL